MLLFLYFAIQYRRVAQPEQLIKSIAIAILRCLWSWILFADVWVYVLHSFECITNGGSSGIPRKTAAGTLPSTFQDDSTDLKEKSQTPPSLLQQQFSAPLDLKQNKYAQDFFKHVNDVKRSIYQSEMQRNNSLESSRRGPRAGGNNTNSRSSPKRAVSQEPTEPVVTTLPLSRGRPAAGVRPTPAPRTSVQSQLVLPATFMPRDPTPTKRRSQPSGRREFPSLDRLVASNTGTIPKRHSRTMAGSESLSPKFTSKPKGFDAKDSWTGNNAEEQFTPGKRHHRTSSTKSHQNVPGPVTRRKDIPAPPPPSPATYSDLQELKANMEGLQDDTNSRSLESETSESPAVPSPSVRSLTGSHNEKKTRELAEAPLKITIALTDMNIPAEFCSTVSVLGHPDVGPDIGSVEQEDNDVFYDARSEDSGAGSLPSEVCLPQSKGAFGLVACSQEAACGKGSKETIYSERDVNTLPHTDPIAGGPEPSNISDTQGNDIGIASDDAKSKKQGRGTVEEQITPHDVEKLVGMDTCLQTNHWRTESEITDATLRGGKHEEKSSKTRDDEKTQTSAIEQHAAATCLEEKQTSLPALDSNDAPVSTSARANATDVDVDVDFEFSCTTGNTDSAALTHSDRTVDIPVVVTTAGIPAPSRTLTRQDYACLDSSEAQSDDSHLTRDSVTRESQNDELSSSTLEKLDVSTLPLPALPKRRRPRSRTSPSKNLLHRQRHEAIDNANANETSTASSRQQHLKPRQRVDTPEKQKSEISQTPNPAPQKQHLSASQQYVAKRRESLEASNRSFNEKLEARRMHNQIGGGNAANVTTGANNGVPTYLFGDQFQALGGGGPSSGRKSLSPATNKEEIYLNKSGWVQVNTKRGGFKEDSCSGFRRQQNDGTARSRAAGRVIPMDAQGHRTDLAHYSFIYQHQQQKSNVGIAEPKFVGSKVEELIQRNEARLGGFSSRDPALRPGYRIIDPQLASILNERPGFLPVKSPNDLDSPITPILSPPPAFQDNSRTTRQMDRRNSSRQQAPLPLPVLQSEARQSPQHMANGSVKGMVFSRSFEYDTRRPTPTNSYVETFSRSFDGHLSELPLHLGMPPLAGQHERSPNFSTLTGNSPNYLTKRESGGGSSGSLRSRDSSPKFLSPQTTTAYLNASVKEAPPAYSMSGSGAAATGTQEKYSPRSRHERSSERSKIHALGRSRKSQFNRMGSAGPPAAPPSSLGMGASRFRSFDTTKSQRLNSCDSGARSDLSNDELDNEDGGLSEFLSAGSQKFPKPCSSSVSISPFKMQRQRSLTPDRNESHSSSSSLRKQRSLTPESRSLTPEERRKKGSQLSLLGSRQNSGSRNNTLEARQRHGEKTSPNISRSSSSSSYSGGDSHDCLNASTCSIVAGGLPCPIPGSGPTNHRRDIAAAQSAAKQAEQEHRIRRSRSLQLSERSPNRVHKSIVNVCAVSAQQPQLQPKQPPTPSYQQPRLGVRAVFPPTVRTPPAANKIPAPLSASSRNTTRPGKNEADKARSFDFDYNNFNRSGGSKAKSPRSIHTSGSGGDSGGNQNQRIERETRSFDEEYREAVLNNNNGSSGSISGVRYLQPAADSGLVPTGSSSTSRLRQSSSPVNGSGVEYTASRSPQSSGSSSNILHQPTRKTGSPQSYGTRLCDHELTFEMLRKSPIMNFRRGDSSDFELPVLLRNRETINSGGNSELNFMSNETRIYEHPTTVLKPQRSLRQSPGSRDDLPLEVAVGVGGDYIYRPAPSQPRSSSASSQSNESTTTKSFSKTLTTCDYWPRCGACQYSLPVVTTLNQEPELKPHITTVAVNIPNVETKAEKLRPCVEKSIIPQWTFLCSGVADCRPQEHSTMTTNDNERRQLMAVVRPRVVPSASTSLFLLGEGNLCLANAAESENEACPQVLAAAEIGLRNLQDEHEFTEVNKKCRWRERSLSLPSPTIQRYLETEESMPKTGNRGVKVVGKGISNNTFAGGLSQQIRAVSSPSLTEPYSESRKLPVESTTSADGSSTVATITSSGSGGGGVGLGVLLKFKRTFNNFNNKNQLHITPALPTSAASNGNPPKSKSSPTTPSVSITTAGTETTSDCAGTDGGDGSSGKYRFGPLIWRTSRERRKTKFNRRDKCNSGDSGIQIELEHDEQYSRVLALGAQGEGVRQGEGGTIASGNTSIGSESKTRSIRRTNSAKASSILGSVALISKNHMQLDFGGTDNIEREAPESLPTRSLSQPNGLEAYGIGYPDISDSDSDSIASHEEATSYYPTIYAEVLYNFTAGGPQELGLERGMLIEILRKEVGPWWFGRIKKEETNRVDEILDPELGWFPKEFVRIIQCPETDRFFNAHQAASEAKQASTTAGEVGDSVPVPVADFPKDADVTMATDQSNITTIVIEAPPLSSNGVFTLENETVLRRGAVRELLDTEVNYVKLLEAICDGYLPAMSKRIDIFSPNSIRLIFSNITAIYKFQAKFLDSLRKGIEQNQIAKVFLKMHKGFLCYSNYCNAYPRALIELESYDRVKDARTILENCRESENLAELPLSAHLLAPVQRICRYPLHLNEIIKSALASAPETGIDKLKGSSSSDYEQLDVNEMDIPDTYDTVNLALEAMRGITEAVNEGKRHSETIARHQASFQNFKGPPLHFHSARFFLQVDATRQKQNLWNSSYTLFLFDNQLVYCKRDIIKRSHFIYKGRIFFDRCRVVNVRDGKMFGHTIKNSLRIYCESRDKWYDFSFRSANRKHRFLNTLALERQFGGKALHVSEMTGFEYTYEERPGDFSDQSDYELADFEHALCATSASGESSFPESPAKSASRFCDTLPKKSQSRDGIASVDNSQMLSTTTSTGSLGRRRIGNWFRKPKSSNCTPSQSPTHKPVFDADETLTAARVAAIELADSAAALLPTDSSFA
ncbi:uncharacterized protein LOC117588983 isoform X1 [Drosophila guanche]|uniref:uncharacterized protein LOC117588983 isoform X1 n=1 Tax=Drosophila guanche TaxID=7266 RepID=UPI001471C10F|nr:uncharacterized protein LOC117588983 isoform X1 [Drosophila guanche]